MAHQNEYPNINTAGRTRSSLVGLARESLGLVADRDGISVLKARSGQQPIFGVAGHGTGNDWWPRPGKGRGLKVDKVTLLLAALAIVGTMLIPIGLFL